MYARVYNLHWNRVKISASRRPNFRKLKDILWIKSSKRSPLYHEKRKIKTKEIKKTLKIKESTKKYLEVCYEMLTIIQIFFFWLKLRNDLLIHIQIPRVSFLVVKYDKGMRGPRLQYFLRKLFCRFCTCDILNPQLLLPKTWFCFLKTRRNGALDARGSRFCYIIDGRYHGIQKICWIPDWKGLNAPTEFYVTTVRQPARPPLICFGINFIVTYIAPTFIVAMNVVNL